MAAHDIDRSVAATALKSWEGTFSGNQNANDLTLNEFLLSPLGMFTQRAILDPCAVYAHLNPAQVPVVSTLPQKKGPGGVRKEERADPDMGVRKSEDIEESEQDRKARLRVGAFGALRWMLGISFILS
jgi:E3 ubiquitin-protein ligase listerin